MVGRATSTTGWLASNHPDNYWHFFSLLVREARPFFRSGLVIFIVCVKTLQEVFIFVEIIPLKTLVRVCTIVHCTNVTFEGVPRSKYPEMSSRPRVVSSPAHFRPPFCNGPKGGLAHLLDILIPPFGRLPKFWQAPPCVVIRNLAASFAHLRESYLGILSNEMKLYPILPLSQF